MTDNWDDDWESPRVKPYASLGKSQTRNLVKSTIKIPFLPTMNKYENRHKNSASNTVTLALGLPGLDPGDVTIKLLHDKLTISGECVDNQLKEGVCIGRELSHGPFSRVVTVPLGLRLQDFNAQMENGLLIITFPKVAPEQVPQCIPIASAPVLDLDDN